MHGRSERLARGLIAGSFATAIAALSHVLGGGEVPGALALGTGTAFAVMLATVAMGRRPSLPRLAVAVAGSQLAFHLLFSFLTPGTAVAPTGVPHHGILSPSALGAVTPMHHGDEPAMWVAHALAMVATVLFLRRVELAVWRMLSRALGRLRFVPGALAPVPIPVARRGALQTEAPSGLGAAPFLAAISRRGPPALAAH